MPESRINRSDPSLSQIYGDLKEDRIDDVYRARVRRRVFDRLATGTAGQRRTQPRLRFALAAATLAAGVVLAVGMAFWLHPPGGEKEPVLTIQANGGVHLEWSDVGQERYEVIRSSSPADFSGARREWVQGTAYVDSEPAENPIVYYRVN